MRNECTTVRRDKFGSLPVRALKKAGRFSRQLAYITLTAAPYFHFLKGYAGKQSPITLKIWFMQKVLGFNRHAYWGVHFTSKINQHKNIIVGVESNPGIEPGCYIQGLGKIFVGDYTEIAPNVTIVSANHDPYDLNKHITGVVSIGSYCWIGANAAVLPGVSLGDFTVVGAGSVVTKSFPNGFCVIAGNPARKIRDLDPQRCVRKTSANPYVGYMRKQDFEDYRSDFLWV